MAQSKQVTQNQVMVAGIAILAAGVGALTAMLLAPKPGKELRGDLKDMANERARHMRHMKHHMQNTADEVHDKMMDGVDAAAASLHDATGRVSDAAKSKLDDTASSAIEMSDHIEEELRRRHKK